MKVKDAVKKSVKKAEKPVDSVLQKLVDSEYTVYILILAVVVIAVLYMLK